MSQSVFCQVRRVDILCSVDAVFLLAVNKEELRSAAVIVASSLVVLSATVIVSLFAKPVF